MENLNRVFLKSLTILGLSFMIHLLNAQNFVEPLERAEPLVGFPAVLVDNEGREIRGKFVAAHLSNNYIKWVTIKSEEGEKVKLNGELVKSLKVKAANLVKLTMFAESTSSVKKMVKTDYNEIIDKEHFIFERILMPKKKDKYALVQLLNPGFDSKIKVFLDPKSKETKGIPRALTGGIKVTGGEDKSYLYWLSSWQIII